MKASVADCSQNVVFRSRQMRFLDIPQAPLCYWLRERLFKVLAGKTLQDVAHLAEPSTTGNNERFMRGNWEVPTGTRWYWASRGGGYSKWEGFKRFVLEWELDGIRIKNCSASYVRNEQLMFGIGITYTEAARGALGARRIRAGETFCKSGPGIFPKEEVHGYLAMLNSRFNSYLLRVVARSFMFSLGSLASLPVVDLPQSLFGDIESICIDLKHSLTAQNPLERACNPTNFVLLDSEVAFYYPIAAALHTIEGFSESVLFDAYELNEGDRLAILHETGTPAAWLPLVRDYDTFPDVTLNVLISGLPTGLSEFLRLHQRLYGSPDNLANLKYQLRLLYKAGPGVNAETENVDNTAASDEDEEQVIAGAHIPIPAETFIEELSQKMKVHPISVYWMLKEGIENDGWRCLPEEQRLTKDRFTVLILRLLGHRWPRQIEAGEPVPAWADDDGIIPLIEGTDEATLNARLRGRLAADYGDERVSSEENTFEDIMGKPLAEWVRKDFFRHHTSQFKKRPIAWHISSSKWASRPRQDAAFECLIYYQKTDGDILPKLKNQYVILLLKRLEMEQRSLENTTGDLNDEQKEKKDSLRYRIQELKAFEVVLTEVSASGFGPEALRPQLRQYAINDAMLCLKARWLKKLSGAIQAGPLVNWRDQADKTGLHEEFSTWITNAITHIDCHCAAVGPKPPPEKTQDDDPTAQDLAEIICAESDAMITEALRCACAVWWKTFDAMILKPISEKIRDAKKEHQLLKDQFRHPKGDYDEQSDMNRKINAMKSDINAWQKELTLKSGRGKAVRYAVESWSWPEAIACESWLAEQSMYDQLSSLNGKRPPPQTVAEFIRQESLYQPDINDGVRVNIAPLQKAGLLAADVLAGKDVVKSIADRAAWRDDERRWCREGKLPKPGWWEYIETRGLSDG